MKLEAILESIGSRLSNSPAGQKSIIKVLRKSFPDTNYAFLNMSANATLETIFFPIDLPEGCSACIIDLMSKTPEDFVIPLHKTPNEVVKERVEKVKEYYQKQLDLKQARIDELEKAIGGPVISDIKLLENVEEKH